MIDIAKPETRMNLNGEAGRFEWIVQNQQVTHRLFVKGGGINGIPILK